MLHTTGVIASDNLGSPSDKTFRLSEIFTVTESIVENNAQVARPRRIHEIHNTNDDLTFSPPRGNAKMTEATGGAEG